MDDETSATDEVGSAIGVLDEAIGSETEEVAVSEVNAFESVATVLLVLCVTAELVAVLEVIV